MEERTEQQIQVRQVTHVQASWTEQERGAPGAFTLQLILDNSVEAPPSTSGARCSCAPISPSSSAHANTACRTMGVSVARRAQEGYNDCTQAQCR
jgi:hypothetical protein